MNAFRVCEIDYVDVDAHRLGGEQSPPIKHDFKDNTAVSNSFWKIAILAMAGMLVGVSSADAATYYYLPDNNGYSQRPQYAPRYRQKAAKQGVPKVEQRVQEGKKPTGPLIIAISIERQSLKVYDANGIFAETPISTGMRGHPTPMGVFSIIQKHKLHHSNIYSGAPMPFMQRITWLGIAMHAGVLPGYPASHGCIRMPVSFATKMWTWTRMGARVVVTPGEITPASFSHPLLVAQKSTPQLVASAEPQADGPSNQRSDKAASAADETASEVSSAKLELKPTLGSIVATPTADQAAAAPMMRETRTADASNAASGDSLTISDAASTSAETKSEASTSGSVNADLALAEMAKVEKTDDIKIDDIKVDDVKTDAAKSETLVVEPAASPAASASADKSDLNKDQTRVNEMQKPAKVVAIPPKRAGQIAVFISRKDAKLYVRQNFSPLFEVPVTIAPSDRPLGRHVFTAKTDGADATVLHWSVVSLPARHVQRYEEDDRPLRRTKMTGAVEVKPIPASNTATEALDRLTIPPDAMARIVDALSTGGSIIVSDQGISGGETGEGTDFIVSLR